MVVIDSTLERRTVFLGKLGKRVSSKYYIFLFLLNTSFRCSLSVLYRMKTQMVEILNLSSNLFHLFLPSDLVTVLQSAVKSSVRPVIRFQFRLIQSIFICQLS